MFQFKVVNKDCINVLDVEVNLFEVIGKKNKTDVN